jgi:hypothetical protein
MPPGIIMRCSSVLLLAAIGIITPAIAARAQEPAPAAKPAPAANPADVASPEAILAATYDVISGPAGQKRDWNRFRSLFIPGARLITTDGRPGAAAPVVIDPEQYIKFGDPYLLKNGFFENAVANRSERYGHIMHIFSTYESRHKADAAAPFARGINSFQLYNDGKRWWIVTIYWQEETPELPLPKEFLSTPK